LATGELGGRTNKSLRDDLLGSRADEALISFVDSGGSGRGNVELVVEVQRLTAVGGATACSPAGRLASRLASRLSSPIGIERVASIWVGAEVSSAACEAAAGIPAATRVATTTASAALGEEVCRGPRKDRDQKQERQSAS
jgi:hypothetical protein